MTKKIGKKRLFLVVSMLLTLALTGGMFAYTYTTASATIGAIGESDYAAVEPEDEIEFATRVFGHYRGDLPTGNLFSITPDADYTGDLNVKVYLTNADELTYAYKHLNMMLSVIDSEGNTMNVDWTEAYEQARDHYGTAGTNFASAESTFNTADTTFDTAEATYLAGGPMPIFLNAVDTYQKAVKTYQSGIVTYQAEADSFRATAEAYDPRTNSAVQGALVTWQAAETLFDTRVSTWNTAVTNFNTAVNTYKAGGSESTFTNAVGTTFPGVTTPFQGYVDTMQGADSTFFTVVDTYLESTYVLGTATGAGTATWSKAQSKVGTYSASLFHTTTAGSVYAQFIPDPGITVANLASIAASPAWSFWYKMPGGGVVMGPQLELRFTAATCSDPDGAGHVDVTLMPSQNITQDNEWHKVTVEASSSPAVYYGNDPTDGSAFSSVEEYPSGTTLSNILASINAEDMMTAANPDDSASDWQLTRVRIELWEGGIERTCYIDDVTISGKTYSVELPSDISELGHTWQLLTLDNGAVALDLRPSWGVSPFYVHLSGGGFATHGRSPIDWNTDFTVEPLLYCEVTQR